MAALVPVGEALPIQRSPVQQGFDLVGRALSVFEQEGERAERYADRFADMSQGACSLSGYALDRVQKSAAAAIACSEAAQGHVSAIAGRSLELSAQLGIGAIAHEERLVRVIEDLQKEIRRIQQEAQNERGIQYKRGRQELVETLKLALAGFEEIIQHPEQANGIALRFTSLVRGLIDPREREMREEEEGIVREKKRKEEEEKRAVRERTQEARRTSRTAQIDLVYQLITHQVDALKGERENRVCLIFFLSVIPFVCTYFLDKRWVAALASVAWPAAYYLGSHFNEIRSKREWIEIYLSALNALRENPDLTVREAVDLQIKGSLGISPPQGLLEQIASQPVRGSIDERRAMIPAELQPLVNHAQSPTRFFFPNRRGRI